MRDRRLWRCDQSPVSRYSAPKTGSYDLTGFDHKTAKLHTYRSSQAMSTAEIITRTSVIRRDVLGIIRGRFRIADETVDDARENVGAVRKLSDGRRALLLIDTRVVTALPLEARSYYVSDHAADTI